jgi:pyruvate/2-oxoglutarate dehydrogenase complex dihydrolipoamide acyltransferase (E2) component
MGRIHKAVVVTADDQLQAREVFELKFTYDERVEDGFYCARALERLAELLAHPDLLLEAPDLPLFAATSSPGSAC